MQYDSYKDSGEQWLGQIPSHWEMLAIRYILQPQHKVVGKKANEYALLSLTLNGVIKRDMDNPIGKFPTTFDTYQEVNPDDFIFCMFDNEETPQAVGLSRYRGMITGAYDVMQNINALVKNRFLEYYFLDIDNFKKLKPLYKGLRKTVPLDSFKAMKIAIPPLPEQERIVAYLDKETAAIDAAIAQQQRMIDLLNERKQIIIQQAVTKGLDPNAKMKDSGIDWIGQIPEGWEVCRIKNKCRVDSGDVFSKENLENNGEFPVYGGGSLIGYGTRFNCTSQNIIVGRVGSCGKVNFPKTRFWATDNALVLTAHDIDLDYLYYVLVSANLSSLNESNAQPLITATKIKGVYIPLPPIEIQQKISHSIDGKLEKINLYNTNIEQQISLLRERKQIIINEVVTGKIKV